MESTSQNRQRPDRGVRTARGGTSRAGAAEHKNDRYIAYEITKDHTVY
jgi:hypothetical protein